jgi:hypothetical protein
MSLTPVKRIGADEGYLLAVGGDDRIGLVVARGIGDPYRLGVPRGTHLQRVDVYFCAAAVSGPVANVGDPVAAREPAWIPVPGGVVGKVDLVRAVGVHRVDFAIDLLERRMVGKYDLLAVRRLLGVAVRNPGGVGESPLVGSGGLHPVDLRLPVAVAGEGYGTVIAREGSLGRL